MDRRTYFTNFIWRSLERWGALGIAYVVSIILARLLGPEAYGTIALVTVLITILDIFLDSGFGNALIQKKDADDIDFSSVFYFNLLFSILLYVLLFFLAPVFARFYDNSELTVVIRVMGLSVIITGIKNIQQAYVAKNMLFKHFFFATLIGTVTSAIISLILAYKGFGVWALVEQYVGNNLIDTICLWIMVKWRPKRVFSFARLKTMFSFGWKLLASNLVYEGYTQLRQLLIGKFYTPSDLAYYNQGYQLPNLISSNISSSVKSIIFPAMANVQGDIEHVKSMLRRSILITQYVVGAFVLGLAACAEPFVSVIYTDKWLPCVPYLRIFCLAFITGQMGTANHNAMIAVGRSDLRLKTEIIKSLVDIVVLVITVFISPMAVAIGYLICTILRVAICAWPNKRLLEYSAVQQFKDLIPNLIIGFIMAVSVWMISLIGLPSLVTLIIQVPFGVIVYVGLSIITKNESFYYVYELIKPYISRKRGSKK